MINLVKHAKLTRISNAAAAGVTTIDTSAVDMKGFDSVSFLVGFGTIVAGAATSIKVQQSNDSGGSPDTFDDLAGTSVTIADTDDNKIAAVEIARPQKRYLRVRILRATQNSTVDFVLAMQNTAGVEPVVHDSATVVTPEFWHAPAEGTA